MMSTAMVKRMMDEGMTDEAMLAKMVASGMTEDDARAMLKRMRQERKGSMAEALIESVDSRLIEAVPGSEGREWDVILIESGLSLNGRYYPSSILEAAAPLFNGARAFADHATDQERRSRPERSVRDLVGVFRDPTYGSHDIGGRVVEGVRARLKVVNKAMRETLKEAADAGEHDYLGFSINAAGSVERREHQGRAVSWVTGIQRVNSVDVVTTPAAGGRLVRLVASMGVEQMDPEELKKLIAEQTAAAVAAAMTASRDTLVSSVVEAVRATPALVAATTPPATPEPNAERLTEADRSAVREARRVLLEARIDRAAGQVTGLSDLGRSRCRRELLELAERREPQDDEILARFREAADYEAQFRANPAPSAVARIQVGDGQADKHYKALVGWFSGQPEDGVPPFRSLREAYCRWKGIDFFDGFNPVQYVSDFAVGTYDSALHHEPLKESLSTSSWAQIFADVQYLMIMRAYRANVAYSKWSMLVSQIESVPDFQTRHWARIGGYGDLVAVAQGGTYQPMTSPGDEEITYAISKRGGVDDITMEVLLADRVNRVRQLPVAMARAAARTLFKFVVNLATTDNPTMDYDSTALYIAGHSNTGTTALSVAGLDTTETAMREQTAFGESSEIIGERNKPAVLIVPNELRARANRIVNPSDTYAYGLNTTGNTDADTSLDPQQYKGSGIQVLVADHFTDATDWFAVANPAEVETIVIGFLNGSREPELFVQDNPTVGSMFTADKITYKVRHVYGGDVLEHRSFYRQVVGG